MNKSKTQNNMNQIKPWESIGQLFEAMNESLEYCVLRNTEDVTVDFSPVIHGDIDIIVRDQQAAVQLMHAQKVHKKSYRVYYEVPVAGGVVPFDIRFVGDNYYCKKWESDVLDTRVLVERGGMKYYMMSPEQQYYTLLYHVYLQKQSVAKDYPGKLVEYAKHAGIEYKNEVELVLHQLGDYMKTNMYKYEFPHDLDVEINWKNLQVLSEYEGGVFFLYSRKTRIDRTN
jgi:hypothetical protein